MSGSGRGFGAVDDDANFLGGLDYSQITQIGKFVTATVSINEINANGTEQFTISEDESIVESVDVIPGDSELPNRARLISVRVNVEDGTSTDTDVKVYQSNGFEQINEVVRITELAAADTPDTFLLAGGIGTPFTNKQGEHNLHVEIDENSGNTATYELEINWLNIPR